MRQCHINVYKLAMMKLGQENLTVGFLFQSFVILNWYLIKVDSFKGKVTIKMLNSTFEWRQWLGCGTYWIFPLLKHDTMVIYSFSISFNWGKIQKWGWKHILCQIYVPPPFKRIILCKKTLYQNSTVLWKLVIGWEWI